MAPQVQKARLSQQIAYATGTVVQYTAGSTGTLTTLRPLQPELGVDFRLALHLYLGQLNTSAAGHLPDDRNVSLQGPLSTVPGLLTKLIIKASIAAWWTSTSHILTLWPGRLTDSLPWVQIRVVNSMGIPYAKHRGVERDAMGVRADSSRGMGVSGLPFMAVSTSWLIPLP